MRPRFIVLLIVLISAIAGGLSSCLPLRPLEQRTFTFTPGKMSTMFGKFHAEDFGVCLPANQAPTPLYMWHEFRRQVDHTPPLTSVTDLAGYEIGVQRGQSCHKRWYGAYQAGIWFDLSSLPDNAAVISAELNILASFSPVDPAIGRGTREQCTVMMVGEAIGGWGGEFYDPRLPDLPPKYRFIPWRPARIHPGPYSHISHVDVTGTVGAWARGARRNDGFTITPDLTQVQHFLSTTDQRGYMCDVGISGATLKVVAAVPTT